jgi:hypothetical protein
MTSDEQDADDCVCAQALPKPELEHASTQAHKFEVLNFP